MTSSGSLIEEIKRNRASNPIYGGRLADALLAIEAVRRAHYDNHVSLDYIGFDDYQAGYQACLKNIFIAINSAGDKAHDH